MVFIHLLAKTASWRFTGLHSLLECIAFCFFPAQEKNQAQEENQAASFPAQEKDQAQEKNQAASDVHPELYHEKQHKDFCLQHALNNLLQGSVFSRREMNDIADRLHSESLALEYTKLWLRPQDMDQKFRRYREGNYDANVLEAALDTKNKRVEWMRRGERQENDETGREVELPSMASYGDNLVGIIYNSDLGEMRHWVAICKVEDYWYDFDSVLDDPRRFNGEEELMAEMATVLDDNGHVFVVLEKDAVGHVASDVASDVDTDA